MIKKYLQNLLDNYTDDSLMDVLKAVQKEEGCLSKDTMLVVSEKINIPLAKLYSVASFYSFFSFEKQGKNIIRICNSVCCHMKQISDIIKTIEEITGVKAGESNDKFTIEKVQCIGCCDTAPAMLLNGVLYDNLTKDKITEILSEKC
jgi:NADH-quinone oxidoreductase subunit E